MSDMRERAMTEMDALERFFRGEIMPGVTIVKNEMPRKLYYGTTENFYETSTHVVWEIALPGFDKDDIKVSYNSAKDMVCVTAAKKTIEDESDRKYAIHSIKTNVTTCRRLVDTFDRNKMKMSFDKGILTIKVEKNVPKNEDIEITFDEE